MKYNTLLQTSFQIFGGLALSVAFVSTPQTAHALELPWMNADIQQACEKPLSIRANAQREYRSCYRLVGGREMQKEIRCRDKKDELKKAEQEVEKCRIWATHKLAEEYEAKRAKIAEEYTPMGEDSQG